MVVALMTMPLSLLEAGERDIYIFRHGLVDHPDDVDVSEHGKQAIDAAIQSHTFNTSNQKFRVLFLQNRDDDDNKNPLFKTTKNTIKDALISKYNWSDSDTSSLFKSTKIKVGSTSNPTEEDLVVIWDYITADNLQNRMRIFVLGASVFEALRAYHHTNLSDADAANWEPLRYFLSPQWLILKQSFNAVNARFLLHYPCSLRPERDFYYQSFWKVHFTGEKEQAVAESAESYKINVFNEVCKSARFVPDGDGASVWRCINPLDFSCE